VRNILVFPGLVIIILTFFMTLPLWAEEDAPYTFSVSPMTGFLYGQGEEIVYKADTGDAYLSQLLWDMKPLFYFGAALDFSRIKPREKWGFFAALSMKFGVPMETGTMEDRDWISHPDWNPTDALTNYSAHNASVDGAYMLDFVSGASLPIRSVVVGKAYLGLSYMRVKWTAQDGYLHYGEYHQIEDCYEPVKDSDPIVSMTGPVMAYSQDWLLFFIGLSASVYVIPKTVLTLSFQGSPLLWYTGLDDHLLTKTQYEDQIFGGASLEPGGSIVFSPHERFSLGFNIAWRYIKGNRGKSKARQTGLGDYEFTSQGNTAGAGYQALDLSLSATIRF
jgi:outer membrane protease